MFYASNFLQNLYKIISNIIVLNRKYASIIVVFIRVRIMEYILTTKEAEYLERQNQQVEKRVNNPNQSPGILIEQHAKNNPKDLHCFGRKDLGLGRHLIKKAIKSQIIYSKLGISLEILLA